MGGIRGSADCIAGGVGPSKLVPVAFLPDSTRRVLGVSRRFVAVGAALALIGSLAACSSGGTGDTSSPATTNAVGSSGGPGGLNLAKSDRPVRIVWAGNGGNSEKMTKEVVQQPFTDATGHTFTNISPQSQPKIKAMQAAGRPIWDVADVASSFTNSNCGKLFEKIDTSLYPNLDEYPAGTVTPCMVPTYKSATIFSYNTDRFPNDPPTSVKDFFDTQKYPGKRVVQDSAAVGLYETALVASGVDPEHLYPLDVARAEKEMDKIKGDLILTPTLGVAQQALEAGQEAMTIMVTARTLAAVEGGAHLSPVWDFTSYGVSGTSILKNAPHAKEAQQLVAFMASKPIEIAYDTAFGYAPVNPDVQVTDIPLTATQKTFNAFQSGRGATALRDPAWYAENYNALVTSFTKWKVG